MNTAYTDEEMTQRHTRAHLESLLDAALADSFPASDPVSNLIADDPLARNQEWKRAMEAAQ